jgi:hypothetical protein
MVGRLVCRLVYNKNNNTMFMLLFALIWLNLLSLSMLATMASAQVSSNSTPGSSNRNSTSNDTSAKQMGICQVGAKSACNGNSVQ